MTEENIIVEKNLFSKYVLRTVYLFLIILYLYIAIKEYPIWRRIGSAFFTRSRRHGNESQPLQIGNSDRSLIFYIPFLPFAVLYLALRMALDFFRLFIVFYPLYYAETVSITSGNYIISCAKKVPEICAAIPSFLNTYIISPFLKIIYTLLDWMYKYCWPVVKQLAITGWTVCTTVIVEGKKIIVYSFHKSIELSITGWNDFGYPLTAFIAQAFDTLIIKPVKWIVPRIKYLARVSWHCACFLARDLAKDVGDLLTFVWSTSMTLWNRIFKPIGHFFYHSTITLCHKVLENYSAIRRFLYVRLILPGINDIVNIFYGICSNKTFRYVVESFISIFPFLYNSLVSSLVKFYEISKIMIPIWVKRIKECGLEIIQDSYITCMDIIAFLSWTYHIIILPIINIIPVVRHLTSSMYRYIKGFLLDISVPVWNAFKLLLRPVISTLSFFYTTVILMIIFTSLRFAKWIISLTSTMLNHALKFTQQSLSLVFKAFELAYNAILPHFNNFISIASERVLIIYDFTITYLQWFTLLISEIITAQMYASKAFLTGIYVKCEPMVIDLGQRAVEMADSAVNNIGQGMMEWVKREGEIRNSMSQRLN
ncbi:26557_t:CDS:1 [Dentiscutata erythropus]|uniref:26557_t:CDS:1 n=1 Tax=Dentiscutata erythropus TaxID=1348616 RepID=A0A9N9CZM3_9GLOM|nr:26557_t:CDS:1 [Dentiscutata erythropus]